MRRNSLYFKVFTVTDSRPYIYLRVKLMASLFDLNIKGLKGVGEKRSVLFSKLGAPTVGDLLRLYPRNYEDWNLISTINNATIGEICVIEGMTDIRPTEQRVKGGMLIYKCTVTDGENDLKLTFFNNKYIPQLIKPGEKYLFRGKVTGTLYKKEMASPEFIVKSKVTPILPIYPQTSGLSSRQIGNAVTTALQMLPEQINDPIPKEMRAKYGLCHLNFALENIHFPKDRESLELAVKRLIFEELLILQLGLRRIRGNIKTENLHPITKDYSQEFFELLPFTPTGAQIRATKEGIDDMLSPHPMNRLIQGDVGSGKTAVAAALCYTGAKNSFQSALMAPTEILATQHFHSLSSLLENTGIKVELLTGSTGIKKKRELYQRLSQGEIDVVVGTHALISEGLEFRNLGLVITDEQHRFGVNQRSALAEKGKQPHTLVMSATPIPRTLALMIYGDLDISVLDELPPGRQKIETYSIDSSKRLRAFGYIQKHLDEGRQAYIICPLIDQGENDRASVTEYAEELTKYFSNNTIGILHGKMKPKEKDSIMEDFSDGNIQILVSTTVVEVGVDVPNAVIMMIENAELYGLSQLHQLRGRVGRGKHKSTCILVSDAQNEEALSRLKIMCTTSDGFKIADEDLRLRGPGDFFGQKQHGLPQLKIADMMKNISTLKEAQEAAEEILAHDPQLTLPQHKGLKAQCGRLFRNNNIVL